MISKLAPKQAPTCSDSTRYFKWQLGKWVGFFSKCLRVWQSPRLNPISSQFQLWVWKNENNILIWVLDRRHCGTIDIYIFYIIHSWRSGYIFKISCLHLRFFGTQNLDSQSEALIIFRLFFSLWIIWWYFHFILLKKTYILWKCNCK